MLLAGTTLTPVSDAAMAVPMNCRDEIAVVLATKVIKARVNEIVKILFDVSFFFLPMSTLLILFNTMLLPFK